jgi:hypothetical protein
MITSMADQRVKPLEQRKIWCNKYRCERVLKSCVACKHRANCVWRENGAMKRVKVNWGGR